MTDIFISYASLDRPRVKPLVDALQQQGWSVWWDRTILAGKTFDRVIEAALKDSRCVIVLWSGASIESDWVLTEADEGKRRAILVPAMLDDVNIPFAFRRIQTANLVGWSGVLPNDQFSELARAVSDVLSNASTTHSDIRPTEAEAAEKERQKRKETKRKSAATDKDEKELADRKQGEDLARKRQSEPERRVAPPPEAEKLVENQRALQKEEQLAPSVSAPNSSKASDPTLKPGQATAASLSIVPHKQTLLVIAFIIVVISLIWGILRLRKPAGTGAPAAQRSEWSTVVIPEGAPLVLERAYKITAQGSKPAVESYSFSFSPDGRVLALTSTEAAESAKSSSLLSDRANASLQLWDADSGTWMRSLQAFDGSRPFDYLRSAVFNPDARFIATLGKSNAAGSFSTTPDTLNIWDAKSGKVVRNLRWEGYDIAFSSDGRLLAGTDRKSITVWNVDSGFSQQQLNSSSLLAFQPKTHILAVFDTIARKVDLWDIDKGKRMPLEGKGHGGYESWAFSPDGNTLAAADFRGYVDLWDVKQAQIIRTLRPPDQTSAVDSLTFSPDGRILLMGVFYDSDAPDVRKRFSFSIDAWSVPNGQPLTVSTSDNERFYSSELVINPIKPLIAIRSGSDIDVWRFRTTSK